MKIALILVLAAGLIACCYCLLFFSFGLVIVSVPDSIAHIKSYIFLYAIAYLGVGIYFIYTYLKERKRLKVKAITRSFTAMLIDYRFRLPIEVFAIMNMLGREETKKFLQNKFKTDSDYFTMNKNGEILYSVFNKPKKSKK